jgi:hypothetical protein
MKAMSTPPSNLYYLSEGARAPFGSGTDAASATGATGVTEEDVKSGKLTTMLNEGQEEEDFVFFQNLNEGEQTDPYPIIGGQPEHKIVYQGTFGEKTSTEDTTDYNFYVNEGGRLADLPLVNAFSTPVAFIADHASCSRETTNIWETVYLPFAVESNDNVQFYEIVPEQTEGGVLAIAPCDMLNAYTPGFFRLANGTKFEIEANNAPVAVPPLTNYTVSNLIFVGLLKKASPYGGIYQLNGDTYQYTEEVETGPFQFFMTNGSGGEFYHDITIHVVDATGIISPRRETEDGASIYNLSGQRIMRIQKGINIINGKKILK